MINYTHRGVDGVAIPTRSVVTYSSLIPSLGRRLEMPTSRGRESRGATSSSGGQNHTYSRGLTKFRSIVG